MKDQWLQDLRALQAELQELKLHTANDLSWDAMYARIQRRIDARRAHLKELEEYREKRAQMVLKAKANRHPERRQR